MLVTHGAALTYVHSHQHFVALTNNHRETILPHALLFMVLLVSPRLRQRQRRLRALLPQLRLSRPVQLRLLPLLLQVARRPTPPSLLARLRSSLVQPTSMLLVDMLFRSFSRAPPLP